MASVTLGFIAGSTVFVACSGSDDSNTLVPKHSPKLGSGSSIQALGILGDIVDFLGDVIDVVTDDAEGFARGAGIGAGIGAVVDDDDPVRGAKNGAIIGGVVYGAIDSYHSAKEKITGDSSTNGNTGKILYKPSASPYGSSTCPSTSDSIGWLHNDLVVYLNNQRYAYPLIPERDIVRIWCYGRGWDPEMIDSITAPSRYNSIVSGLIINVTSSDVIVYLNNQSKTVEASEYQAMKDQLDSLEEVGYSYSSARSIVASYRARVAGLGISTARKDAHMQTLIVSEYSFALWHEEFD